MKQRAEVRRLPTSATQQLQNVADPTIYLAFAGDRKANLLTEDSAELPAKLKGRLLDRTLR